MRWVKVGTSDSLLTSLIQWFRNKEIADADVQIVKCGEQRTGKSSLPVRLQYLDGDGHFVVAGHANDEAAGARLGSLYIDADGS